MYSKDQVSRIRQLINDHFERGDVYDKLKQKISSSGLNLENLDNNALTKLLEETDLLENLMLDVKHLEEIQSYNQRNQKGPLDFDKINYRSVSLRVYRGKAFLDFINEPNESDRYLQLFLSFGTQRFQSKPVKAEVEPDFHDVIQILYGKLFVFDLRSEGTKANMDLLTLSKNDQPVEIAMILIDDKNQTRELYSQKLVEWRFLLTYGNINLNIEMPITHEARQRMLVSDNPYQLKSMGILQVHLDLLPKAGLSLIPESILTNQISKEKALIQSQSDRFHTYSSAWWNDFKELKLPVRPIKIYAESQDGVWRPSTTFVSELVAVRGIPTPNHAARFVSLIPFKRSERGPSSSPERAEVWHRFSTFLSIRNGDFEDHCLLLCSLLLGFQLEAYVCLGASSDGAHGWVMTRQKKPNRNRKALPEYTYHFYESLTGVRYEISDPKIQLIYKRIGCIFNNRSFYANIQPTDIINQDTVNIDDYTKWKAIDPQELTNLKPQNGSLKVLPTTLIPDDVEETIEFQLRQAVTSYRKVINASTRFDDRLTGIVSITLANYCNERLTGQTFAQQEFQTAIKGYLPEGHVFKAFPISFTHMNVEKMVEAIKSSPVGAEIITARGDQAYYGLRVMLEAYPEDVYAVWVILAIRYHMV